MLTSSSWRDMIAPKTLGTNLAAGLTIALVALPLNLALALACGLPAWAGLVTGAIAGAVGALVGGSRFQVTGPEVALAPLTLLIVRDEGIAGLLVATFLCGIFQISFGVLRLGRFVRLIPLPVIGGFMTAIGLLVFDTQIPRLLGLPKDVASLHQAFSWEVLSQIHWEVLAVGALAIAVVVLGPRVVSRVPGPLLGLAAATAIAVALPSVPTVEPFAAGFPHPTLPDFKSLHFTHLVPEALALALLASIDSLLCAASIDAKVGGERTRNDQELVAQGFANMASACVGGMPVAAAVVRSMAAVEARASTRLAPLSQSIFLVGVLMLFGQAVTHVPLVALAAILLVVGYRLVDVAMFKKLWALDRWEAGILVTTTLVILFVDFVSGVAVGSLLALGRFAAVQTNVLQARVSPSDSSSRVVALEGPLFFASQAKLDLLFEENDSPRFIVDLSRVTVVDSSGAATLRAVLERLGTEARPIELTRIPEHAVWLRREFIERPSPAFVVVDSTPDSVVKGGSVSSESRSKSSLSGRVKSSSRTRRAARSSLAALSDGGE